MAQKEGINTPLVVTLGLVSGALLLVTVFAVQAWFQYETQQEEASKWETMADTSAATRRAEQLQAIQSSGRSAEDPKLAAIPIEKAMQVIVENGGKMPAAH